jgi:hypothetical protein
MKAATNGSRGRGQAPQQPVVAGGQLGPAMGGTGLPAAERQLYLDLRGQRLGPDRQPVAGTTDMDDGQRRQAGGGALVVDRGQAGQDPLALIAAEAEHHPGLAGLGVAQDRIEERPGGAALELVPAGGHRRRDPEQIAQLEVGRVDPPVARAADHHSEKQTQQQRSHRSPPLRS